MSVTHSFLCVDSATRKCSAIDADGNIIFEKQLWGSCFDIWLLSNENILVPLYSPEKSGFIVFDREGNDVRNYILPEGSYEVFGCQPLENGNIVLGDLRGKCLLEVNVQNEIVSRTPLFYDGENIHEVMRMPRLCRDGKSYLVVQPGIRKIIKYNKAGDILWQADTHRDTFDVVEKENGNLVYSAMEGVFELDTNGNEVWRVTREDIPRMNLCWALALKLSKDGNIVICNWLGHGHTGEGVPIFEVTAEKEVVWSCAIQDRIVNMSSFWLLDET